MSFAARREYFIAKQEYNFLPVKVFPLLCPVREHEWIEGWSCEIVYLKSGYAEEDGIFTTAFAEDGPKETWVITKYLPPKEIEFLRVNPLRVIRYSIELKENGNGGTRAIWRQLITASSEEGNAWLESYTEEKYREEQQAIEALLNRYLASASA